MTPVRPGQFRFKFDPNELRHARERAKLTQRKVADQLQIPVNTLSRWETGASTPDAHALAGLASMFGGVETITKLFKDSSPSEAKAQKRTKLGVFWDLENVAPSHENASGDAVALNWYLRSVHPAAQSAMSVRVFAGRVGRHSPTVRELVANGFELAESPIAIGLTPNVDDQIVEEIDEFCRVKPNRNVLYLVADDGDYAEVLRRQRQKGVEAYIIGTDQCADRLRRAVESGNSIHYDRPWMVMRATKIMSDLGEQQIGRAELGVAIKNGLAEDAIFPEQVGFSRRNPYGSLLVWMESAGLITVKESGVKNKNYVRIKVLKGGV